MNAGKSTSLLQSSYNYNERGMNTLLLSPAIDNRYGERMIASRVGLKAEAVGIDNTEDLYQLIGDALNKNNRNKKYSQHFRHINFKF